jgi:L-2,4-diaminobutyrate transaminase
MGRKQVVNFTVTCLNMELRPSDLEMLDRAHFFHPSTHIAKHVRGESPERVIVGGKGITIVDNQGRESLDAFAGLYCVNVGYGRTEIADAIAEQARKLAYYHAYVGHASEPAIRLASRIVARAPRGMRSVYFGLSGSDANETQLKLIRYFNNCLGRPQKKKVISRWRAYHGSGLATGSMTGLELFHKAFDLPLPGFVHTRAPYFYWEGLPGETEQQFSARCASELEQLIVAEGPETIAAFFAEPVLGTGGLVPPPDGYWEAVQPVLRKYDILLVADEVVTAFGRVGRWFGCELYGVEPDLITIAKGMSSGYLPISGVVVGDRVWKVLQEGTDRLGSFGHGWTYSAHPVCAAAANANLDIVEREHLVEHAEKVGSHFQKRLREAFSDCALVGEARGVGLLGALEFVADRSRKVRFDAALGVGARVAQACLERGMIARAMPQGDILGFAPPLVVSESDVDRIVAITRAAVDSVSDSLARQGVKFG